MSRSNDAEFRAEYGSEAAAGDEVLVVGHRRRLPRWFWPAAIVAVAMLVAGVAVLRAVTHHRSPPTSSTSRSLMDPPLDVGKGAALDVAAYGQHTWVLHGDWVTGLGIAAGRDRTVRLPLDASAPNAAVRLVVDASTGRLWVVLEGTWYGRATEYDLWTLAQLRDVRLRDVRLTRIDTAVAMDGHLYLTSGARLIDVPPRGAARTFPLAARTGICALAADPQRSRVLVLDCGYPHRAGTVWVYRPGHDLVRTSAKLPTGNASIAVTEHAIWLGGSSDDGAVLERLDPSTLHPVLTSPVAGQLGTVAVLLAAGTDDIWIVSGSDQPAGLWCVDGRSGTAEQHWTLTTTAVATDHQRVVVVAGGQVVPLLLRGGCTG